MYSVYVGFVGVGIGDVGCGNGCQGNWWCDIGYYVLI